MPSNLHSTVTIYFNGEPLVVAHGLNVSDLLYQQNMTDGLFAIVLNDEVLAKSHYSTTILNNNDVVDVISPISGG